MENARNESLVGWFSCEKIDASGGYKCWAYMCAVGLGAAGTIARATSVASFRIVISNLNLSMSSLFISMT